MGKRKKYDREFRISAAKLYDDGDKTLRELAEDLGLAESTLGTWVHKYREQGEEGFSDSGVMLQCNEEMLLMRKELESVKQERDILKKAVAIFSQAKN